MDAQAFERMGINRTGDGLPGTRDAHALLRNMPQHGFCHD
jgi:hypothetical protein